MCFPLIGLYPSSVACYVSFQGLSESTNTTNVPTKVELNESVELINPMSDVVESLYQQAIEQLAERAFRAADTNRDGKISFQVRQHFNHYYLLIVTDAVINNFQLNILFPFVRFFLLL
jgi:hypothetical protein